MEETKILTKPGTREHYFAAANQYTVLDTDYENVLNERGLTIYRQVLEKVGKEEFKDEIYNMNTEFVRSGIWVVDENKEGHELFSKENNFKAILCTWQNQVAVGKLKNGKEVTTSVIRFKGPNWIYTISGSLYKIIP